MSWSALVNNSKLQEVVFYMKFKQEWGTQSRTQTFISYVLLENSLILDWMCAILVIDYIVYGFYKKTIELYVT